MKPKLRRRAAKPRDHRRPYAAEELRVGMIVIDPDGHLNLHAARVRVASPPRQLNRFATSSVVVDYEVPGSTATGRFSFPRLAPVWVVGGDGR